MNLVEKPSIIFMGTPEFAVPSLELLHREYGVKAVVTVPDKQQGRGMKMQPSPVKQKAIELNIPVLQPEKLKNEEFLIELTKLKPDIIVVIAFKILPKEIFDIPSIAIFNIHPSLLPKYRGAAPINRTIINGDKETGLTSFIVQLKIDTGDILFQKKYQIHDGFTAGDLHDFLMPEAAQMTIETCRLLLSGDYTPLKQDDTLATPAPKIFTENCKIDWNESAEKLKNFIHGVSPFPGAWTIWEGKRLKILRVKYNINTNETQTLTGSQSLSNNAGSYLIENKNFIVYCGNDFIILTEIQPEGKKAMMAEDFLRGYRGKMNGKFE
jgi:methionyl-tRNA formyltransferase